MQPRSRIGAFLSANTFTTDAFHARRTCLAAAPAMIGVSFQIDTSAKTRCWRCGRTRDDAATVDAATTGRTDTRTTTTIVNVVQHIDAFTSAEHLAWWTLTLAVDADLPFGTLFATGTAMRRIALQVDAATKACRRRCTWTRDHTSAFDTFVTVRTVARARSAVVTVDPDVDTCTVAQHHPCRAFTIGTSVAA